MGSVESFSFPPASRDDVVRLTRDLVRCDTQNPPGREEQVIDTLLAELHDLGCESSVFRAASGRPSVLATYVPTGHEPQGTLLINGHIDVVPVNEKDWSYPPFDGTVEGSRFYGRGSADMKGGIAAALCGLRACLEAGVEPLSRVTFHLVADEECGGLSGTVALANAGLISADACVVPEPTELRVGIAERGTLMAHISVYGEAGHGSEPTRVRSAILDAARVVAALHARNYYDVPHPYLGAPSANCALISGGLARNVVAPLCGIDIDRRVLPGETQEGVLRSLHVLIDQECPDVSYSIEPVLFGEGSEISPGHSFPVYFRGLTKEPSQDYVGLSLGTDARILRNVLGIPTVIYGPGSIDQAHTADEWVEVEQLSEAAGTFARLYSSFSRSSAGSPLTATTVRGE